MGGSHCCVVNCHNRSHDRRGKRINNTVSFYCLPAWKKNEGSRVSEVTKRRRMAWVSAVKRKNITFFSSSVSVKVCSRHFHSGKPAYEMLESHPDWAPTLHLGHNELKPAAGRRTRRSRRTQEASDTPPTGMDEDSGRTSSSTPPETVNVSPAELGMRIKVKEEEEDLIDQLLIDEVPAALKEEDDVLDSPEPVHADEDSKLWRDETGTQPPLHLSLYHSAGELGSYFLDEDLTTAVKIHVVGSAGDMEMKPDAVGLCDPQEFEAAASTPEPVQPPAHRQRGRGGEDSPLLEFLRESEAASQTRHEEILNQMKSSQETFQTMMSAFLEKI